MSDSDASKATASDQRRGRAKNILRSMLFWTILGVVVAIASLGFAIWALLLKDDTRRPGLTISEPRNGIVARCARVGGTALLRDEFELWVAVRLDSGQYGYNPARQSRDGTWEAKITAGGATGQGEEYRIFAFYLPHSESNYLRNIFGYSMQGDPGYFMTKTLPPDATDAVDRPIVRDSTSATAC